MLRQIILWSILLLFWLIKPCLGINIELQDKAAVTGKVILLRDIAAITEASEDKLEMVKGVYIGRAPLIGKRRIITQSYVQTRLLQAGLKRGSFEIKGSKEVAIEPLAQDLESKRLITVAEEYIKANLSDQETRLVIEPISSPQRVRLPLGEIGLKVASSFRSTPGCAQVYLPIDILIDGQLYRTVRVNLRLRRFGNVVIAKQDIKRHQILTHSGLEVVEREITLLRSGHFTGVEDIVGQRTTGALIRGSIITADIIEPVPLINRGDVVTIKKELGSLLVTTLGRAQDNGSLNQMIRVQNLDSKVVITGKVKDEGTVILE